MKRLVAGVDGCRAGWVCVLAEADGGPPRAAFVLPAIAPLLARDDLAMIAIDMPIGIPDIATGGGRACDAALRRVLGARQSSVFAVPARAAIAEEDHARASAVAFARSVPARKVSRQCFNLFPKIRELDAAMSPALQNRVVECHPEGAFWAMNGSRPLGEPKKVKSVPYAPGLALRRALLAGAGMPAESALGIAADIGSGLAPDIAVDVAAGARVPPGARLDDVLDACACAWTARRVLAGQALCFPSGPSHQDGRGLRMEIMA